MSSPQTTVPEAPEFNEPLLPSLNDIPGISRIPYITAVILTRAAGHRAISIFVSEAAAPYLADRRAEWGYSKPVVAIDMLWNMAFVVVTVAMLACTVDERPNTPIRMWVLVYSLQCMVHAVLVWLEYRCWSRRAAMDVESGEERNGRGVGGGNSWNSSLSEFTNQCQSINTVVSCIWYFLGFYWVFTGGYILLQDARHLFWLAVVFLAFNVVFTIICVVFVCLIGITLCCCFPCIVVIIFFAAIARQKRASEADLSILAKYRFRILCDEEKTTEGAGKMVPIETSSGYLANERILLPEDAGCCICLCSYEDGEDLHALPCKHHFHSTCILEWLKKSATCALYKYDLLKGNEQV